MKAAMIRGGGIDSLRLLQLRRGKICRQCLDRKQIVNLGLTRQPRPSALSCGIPWQERLLECYLPAVNGNATTPARPTTRHQYLTPIPLIGCR
jgi:hypothetical protein